MAMKEIIAVKVPAIQVGDIVCGTTWRKADDWDRSLIKWFPTSLKVTSVTQTHLETPTQSATWWLVTECMDHDYQDDLGPFGADSELHVVARSTGDALIGRGK
jgi:hypothetical protein